MGPNSKGPLAKKAFINGVSENPFNWSLFWELIQKGLLAKKAFINGVSENPFDWSLFENLFKRDPLPKRRSWGLWQQWPWYGPIQVGPLAKKAFFNGASENPFNWSPIQWNPSPKRNAVHCSESEPIQLVPFYENHFSMGPLAKKAFINGVSESPFNWSLFLNLFKKDPLPKRHSSMG